MVYFNIECSRHAALLSRSWCNAAVCLTTLCGLLVADPSLVMLMLDVLDARMV
jgi:hypothetical protein